MKISDFLSASDVMIDVRAASKHQLLLEMSRKAAQSLGLPSEEIYAELERREELGSTAATTSGLVVATVQGFGSSVIPIPQSRCSKTIPIS